jgi:hypothetical protein
LFLGTIVLTGKTQQFKKESSLGDIVGMIAEPGAESADCFGNPAGIE